MSEHSTMVDPDNLLRFRERLGVATEFLCGLTDNPKAREALAAVLYVRSSLLLDAKEMRLEGAETIQTLLDLLNPLHGELDRQTYDDKMKEEFDVPADREYNVDITARMERDLTQAVLILENRKAALAERPPNKASANEMNRGV
jgi:hypothetical protein